MFHDVFQVKHRAQLSTNAIQWNSFDTSLDIKHNGVQHYVCKLIMFKDLKKGGIFRMQSVACENEMKYIVTKLPLLKECRVINFNKLKRKFFSSLLSLKGKGKSGNNYLLQPKNYGCLQ